MKGGALSRSNECMQSGLPGTPRATTAKHAASACRRLNQSSEKKESENNKAKRDAQPKNQNTGSRTPVWVFCLPCDSSPHTKLRRNVQVRQLRLTKIQKISKSNRMMATLYKTEQHRRRATSHHGHGSRQLTVKYNMEPLLPSRLRSTERR